MTLNLKNSLILFLAAVIWGLAFVAQSAGAEYVETFTFNGIRSVIGSLVLIPVVVLLNRRKTDEQKAQEDPKLTWIGGICCGLVLCLASNLQQYGIEFTTVGKAGFITAMYIVLVPIFSIFLKKKAGIKVWIAVLLAVAGLYLLCMTESLSLGKGDLIVLLCAFAFTGHILVIDHFSARVDGVKMSCIQFLVSGTLSLILMFLFETPQIPQICSAWLPLLYAGVMSCGIAYTLQIVGQKNMDPTIASLILSMESVTSVIAGWLILGQRMSGREIGGCILMFCAIILAQLPDRKKKN